MPMAAAADPDQLLADLSSPSSHAGLHSRFVAYLEPFCPHLPTPNPNLKPPPKRTTKQNKQPPPSDGASVRPLAKQFLPFLSRGLQLLPSLLRSNPCSGDGGCPDELLKIYGLLLDCLEAISKCLAGKPYSVLLQRARFVWCLELRGHYARAEEEAAATLDALRSVLSPPTTTKSRRGGASVAPYLPDPAGVAGEAGADPEVTILALELTVCLANCASKGRLKEAAPYERVLSLVKQLQPWLRILAEEASRKHLTLLVNALSRCAIFLAAESSSFSGSLVREFCVATLGECMNPGMIERLPAVARNICSSVDLSWGGSTQLLLDVLKTVVEFNLCVKADLPKAVNAFMEFVAYFSRSFSSSNRDLCIGASELLYEQAGYFSEVSSPVPSILHLYATGFKFSTRQIESEGHSCMPLDFFNDGKYLRTLNTAIGTLARIFCAANGKSASFDSLRNDLSSIMQPGHSNKNSFSQSHEHIYFMVYMDSLEFVCKILLQHTDAVWKKFSEGKALHYSENLTYVLTALHQFTDSSLSAHSCTSRSEGDKERLHEQRRTLLRALVSAIKISCATNNAIQKSLSSINCAISSTWVKLEELKFLMSSIGNIGVTLLNTGHSEEAPKVLELCCQTTLAHVRLSYQRLSARTERHNIIEDLPKDTLKDVIEDAFARIARMIDALRRCGTKTIRDIVVRSLSEMLSAGDAYDYYNSSSVLINLWVKVSFKDFGDDQNLDSAPLLYYYLMGYPSPLPKKLVGLIVEQELLAYELMESRGPDLCAKTQKRIIDILLNEIYCSKEHNLERSRVLVSKARALRASGVQDISSCLDSLSEAISLLRGILRDSSEGSATVIHQLAISYCLHAHCAQEANLSGKVILDNARSAIDLLSDMDTLHHSSPDMVSQQPSHSLVPLLCSLLDLLAMKGCFELLFDLRKLITMIWKQENLPLEKLFSMLLTNGRLNHACCHLLVDQQFISNMVENLGVDCHDTVFWRDCFKGDHPSLSMFLQRLWPMDLFFSEPCERSFGSQFRFSASVDEVDEVASSLVSEVTLDNQSTYLAGYLYYDLSERLMSRGQLFQALSYGKEALHLRDTLLKKKFKHNLGKFGSKESQCSVGKGCASLEARGSAIAEIWLDSTRSTNTSDCHLTPWNVLRCYLESISQVSTMHEMLGNSAEAEVLLRTGKDISFSQGLPVFGVVFSSALGQLYRKRQQWDTAESELKCARDLLIENDAFISCKLCKLSLEVSVDVQTGDLFWSLFEKDFQKQSTHNLSSALGIYQSAMKKLNNSGLEFLVGSYDKLKVSCIACSKDCTSEAKHRARNHGKESLAAKDGGLPSCAPCVLLSRVSSVHCDELAGTKSQRQNLRTAEGAPPLDVKVKRASRNSSRLAKEQNIEAHAKTTTRSSKCTAHVKGEKDLTELDCKNGLSWCDELSTATLVCEKEKCSLEDIGHSRDDICNKFGCWTCIFVKSLNSGCIQSTLQFRWDCIRRRHLVSLLLKIARTLGAHGGNHGSRKVHNMYWQCISLLYLRSFPEDCYRTYESQLMGLITDENTGDFLSLERAEILCSMSFFMLKGFLSEQSRDVCCGFSSVQMSDIVPWLLKAFVLSRESPTLLQEVCRLLTCIFLLSTIDSTIQLPLYSEGSLSLNHWAAYFHQTSVGTYLNCHYLARIQALCRKKDPKGKVADLRSETDEGVAQFLRFSSVDIKHLEKHITEFFHKLPDVPIVCISMLGGDFVNVLGESLLLPSFFPAWMLLSRFDSTSKPITMLLPVDPILEETQHEDSAIKELRNPVRASDKSWHCPWGYTIIDYVVPSFKKLFEDNFLTLSGTPLTPEANKARWWSERMNLNNQLDQILKNMEELWLGPWKCLLLGHQLADQHIEAALKNLVTGLESKFKFEVNPALIKDIISGVASVGELQECVSQLISYKGYFGRGRCCGRDRLRAFSGQIGAEALATLESLTNDIVNELAEPVDRDPVILVLDINVQMLPWENLPVLRNQEIYRMPSMGSIFLALTRSNNHHKDASAAAPPFPVIDPFDTFYLLNPSGDLNKTQEEFDEFFRNYKWKGKAGDTPTPEELILALRDHDLFLYLGHGSGTQYISGKEIEKLDNCSAALLMGCSSGALNCKGGGAPQGAPLSYLFAGSPSVIANLWDVTDGDIDRFTKALLSSWLQENSGDAKNCSKCCQLSQDFESMTIAAKNNGRPRRRGTRGRKPIQIEDGSKSCNCRHRRIASYLSEARRACRLPLLIGASPVCYGVPTIIRKK